MAVGGGGSSSGAVRAGRAFVELSLRDNLLMRGLAGLKNKFANLGKSLAIGGALRTAVGGGSLFLGLRQATETLDDLAKIQAVADAFGIAGESASGLFGVLAQNGGDVKEDIEGLTQFSQRLRDALAGVGGPTGEAARLFEGLSVTAEELANVPLDEAFFRIHEAIRQLPQELQASKLSLVGGTDSMKKWLPLLSKSTEELRAQAAALSSSREDMQTAKETTLAYQQAMVGLRKAWQEVAIAMAPTIRMVAEGFTSASGPIVQFIRNNRELVTLAVMTAAKMAAAGAGLLALSGISIGLSAALGAIVSALGILLSPVGLTGLGVTALALSGQFGELKMAWGDLGEVFEASVGRMRAAWQGVTDAMKAGDLTLAIKIAAAAIKFEFLKLFNVLKVETSKLAAQLRTSISGEALKRQISHMIETLQIQLDPARLGPNDISDQLQAAADRRFAEDMKRIHAGDRSRLDPEAGTFTKEFVDEILIPEAEAFAELENLIREAGDASTRKRVRDAFRDVFAADWPATRETAPMPRVMEQAARAIKTGWDRVTGGGGFGGANLSQRLGLDTKFGQSVKYEKQIADNTAEMVAELKKRGDLVFVP